MLMLGGPLILMFEGSIWVVQWIGVKRKAAKPPAARAETAVGPQPLARRRFRSKRISHPKENPKALIPQY